MLAEEYNALIDDNFRYEYDGSKYTPTNGNIEFGELPSSRDYRFYIKFVDEIVVRVSGEVPKCLTQELFKFLLATTLNACDYETELPFIFEWKSIRKNSARDSLDGLNLKSLFVTYQSHHGPEEVHEFFMKIFVKVLRKQISLAEALHMFMRPVLLDAENDSFVEIITQGVVHLMLASYLK